MTAKEYILQSNDERMMFDWLVQKQIDFGVTKPFRHSIIQVEEATRIKRKMQKLILDSFVSMGFLQISITYHDNNPYRSYFVDFSKLADPNVLGQIIRPGSEIFNHQITNYKQLAGEQKKGLKPPTKKSIKEAEKEAKAIEAMFPKLAQQWNERVDMYNNGELTSQKPARAKVHIETFSQTKNAKKLVGKLRGMYSEEVILKAFMVYADYVLTGSMQPKNSILMYFLTCNDGEFEVVNKCYDYYGCNYGRNNN